MLNPRLPNHPPPCRIVSSCVRADDYGYGYQGRVGRGGGKGIDPTLNFHDPFAALRSQNTLTDPAESE